VLGDTDGPPSTRRLLLRCGCFALADPEEAVVLVELGLVEQRYAAVKDVLDNGASVTDVARRNGVSRSAVHEWLTKYAKHGNLPVGRTGGYDA
jgi:hypothetical protein